MRKIKILQGEHYHIFNRGVARQTIFHDLGDYTRFLFLILYFQSREKVEHLSREVKNFTRTFGKSGRHSVLATLEVESAIMPEKRMVELVCFCIMPNHFDLLLKEVTENGIASYMQRVLNAYAKYYNTKYAKSGHVFQGPYKAVHMVDDVELMRLSAYIHRNSKGLNEWLGNETRYPWSSYQDYIKSNRWGKFLARGVIMDQFGHRDDYMRFVDASLAELSSEELRELGEERGG